MSRGRWLCLAWLCWLPACGGHALDLDQHAAPPSLSGSAPEPDPNVETLPLPDTISNFWVDDARVYWSATTGQLRSCEFDDCAATQVTYGQSNGPIAIGENQLVFSEGWRSDILITCAKSGCDGTRSQVLREERSPFLFAVDAAYVYWISTFDIFRCPLEHCGEIPEIVAANQSAGGALLVQGLSAYWAASEPENPSVQIRTAPVDGSLPPRTIVTKDASRLYSPGREFAIDATSVYWLDSSFHVRSCPLTGCGNSEPATLVTTDTGKRDILVDASGIYWLESSTSPEDYGPGSVRFCPLRGCEGNSTPQTLAANKVNYFQVDSSYVYWDQVDLKQQTANGLLLDEFIQRTKKPLP